MRKLYIKILDFQFLLNSKVLVKRGSSARHHVGQVSQSPAALFHTIHSPAWILKAFKLPTCESPLNPRHQGLDFALE